MSNSDPPTAYLTAIENSLILKGLPHLGYLPYSFPSVTYRFKYADRVARREEEKIFAQTLPAECFSTMSIEREASLRSAKAMFSSIQPASHLEPVRHYGVYSDTHPPGQAAYLVPPIAVHDTGSHEYDDDMVIDGDVSATFVQGLPPGAGLFQSGFVAPGEQLAGHRVVKVQCDVVPAEQLDSHIPIDALLIAMRYVPNSFKVARAFVPLSVGTLDSRLDQFFEADFCPLFFGEKPGSPFSGANLSFPEYTDDRHNYWRKDNPFTRIIMSSRSPSHAYREAMIAKFGIGTCTVYSGPRTYEVIDYQSITARAPEVNTASSNGDVLPDHFIAHFLGMLPPRRVTTYTEGLLRAVADVEPSQGDSTLVTEDVGVTERTGPRRIGQTGGVLLDHLGNITGFVGQKLGVPCIFMWNHYHQAWYYSYHCSSQWQKYPMSHRSSSLSTIHKLAATVVDRGTYGCDQECCTAQYVSISSIRFLPPPPYGNGEYYIPWYHSRRTDCPCDSCIRFLVPNKVFDPADFLRSSLLFSVHQAASRHLPKSVFVRLVFDPTGPDLDIAADFLSLDFAHIMSRCAGDCNAWKFTSYLWHQWDIQV